MGNQTELLKRSPQAFETANIVFEDFDGTVARTFEKSPPSEGFPEGIGVEEAHQITVESVFGTRALQKFIDRGGLRNRAALEVVQELAPDAGDETGSLVQLFIETKLDILLDEIGRRFADGNVWPRPTPGYLEFCERLDAAQNQGVTVDDLIISSGHEPFIRKTYSAWQIAEPTFILAEDTVRNMNLPYPATELVKPSPRLMTLGANMWRASFGLPESPTVSSADADRIVYIGDDAVKDGQLAESSGVDFVLLQSGHEIRSWNTISIWLGIGELMVEGASRG